MYQDTVGRERGNMGPLLKVSVTHAPVPRADYSDSIFLHGLLDGTLTGEQKQQFLHLVPLV